MAIRQFKFFEGMTHNVLVANFNERLLINEVGVDVENALMNHLTEEIAREIDNDILRTLLNDMNENQRA